MAEQSFQSHAHHPRATYVATLFSLAALILLVGQAFYAWDALNWTLAAILLTMKGQGQALPALAIGATLGTLAMSRSGPTEE